MKFLLWVDHNSGDRGGEYSTVEVLSFVGTETPTLAECARLPVMERRYGPASDGTTRPPEPLAFMLLHAADIRHDKLQVLGNSPRPARGSRLSAPMMLANDLDQWLAGFLPGGDHVLRRGVPE